MMKNILKKISFIFVVFAFCLPVFAGFNISSTASAATANETSSEISQTISDILSEYVKFDERVAGSENEKLASEYILQFLSSISGIEAVKGKNDSDQAGVQSFRFTSAIDGKQHNSQNIIFKLNSSKETDKKIIIGTSYDALTFDDNGEKVKGESVNGSAGSVATLLALAKYLPTYNLDFDVEFVFFGAGVSNNAGSKFYANGISNKDKENILLMINLDTIAVGEKLYFYVDEINTELTDFAGKISTENQTGFEKINLSHLGKILLEEPNELGLTYTHIAQDSNNLNFMKLGILSMNIFAGDYSSGIVLGRSEYAGKDSITFTGKDSLSYINEILGEDIILSNLTGVFKMVTSLIASSDFVSVCESSAGDSTAFYNFFANKKLLVYLTICVFFISIVVAALIYYRLSVKAINADLESQFASSVLIISDNFEEKANGEISDIKDANGEIPKIVSQVIANDLKKEKRIKKNKKDDK